jgi:hypothetical protein
MQAALCTSPAFGSSEKWQPECVGRMKVELPGELEVATQRIGDLIEGGREPDYYFEDGEVAPFSAPGYGGTVSVSDVLSDEEKKAMADAQVRWSERSKALSASGKGIPFKWDNAGNPRFEKLSMDRPGTAWRIDNRWTLMTMIEQRAFLWSVSGDIRQQGGIRKDFETLARGLQYRPTNTVPADPGVCLPYSFVADNGNNPGGRAVAITYRLRVHPDVTVMLQDASAARVADFEDPNKFTAIYQSNFFWTQRYRSVKARENLLHGSHNKVKLAGQDAVETMFKLVRKDDAVDYGYLVVARGNPDAKTDVPDLMLYVIQDSKVAKAKGVRPMEKREFFELAKKISTSVTHR